MPSLTNFLLSNYAITAATNTREVEGDYGDVFCFDVLVESVNGSPTAASLAAKFQVSALDYRGLNVNYEPTSDEYLRQWQDVVVADGFTGHLLVDGAWPTSLANETMTNNVPVPPVSVHRLVSRRIIVPSLGRLIRLVLTPSFTGGTAPNFKATVSCSVADK